MRSRRACEWVVLAKHLSVEGESEVRGQIPSLLIQGCPGFSAFRFQFLALIRHLLATLSREQPGGLLSALSLGCVLRLGPNSALTFFCFKPRHVSFSFVCVSVELCFFVSILACGGRSGHRVWQLHRASSEAWFEHMGWA